MSSIRRDAFEVTGADGQAGSSIGLLDGISHAFDTLSGSVEIGAHDNDRTKSLDPPKANPIVSPRDISSKGRDQIPSNQIHLSTRLHTKYTTPKGGPTAGVSSRPNARS